LSAAVKEKGNKYSTFIGSMTKKNIRLDRKMLSNIAIAFPPVFDKIYAEIVK
jgi:ribosomal protein L20